MPKKRKGVLVQCTHFMWRLINRHGIYYADGRSNEINAGRHSLGVKNEKEAQELLPELDRVRAEDLGLIPRSKPRNNAGSPLSLDAGRIHYEKHVARPRVTGGVRKSTQKSYKLVLGKFIPFAISKSVHSWNAVTADLLNQYASHLESMGYAHKTLVNQLTTLKQAIKWLIESGHLQGMQPIELKLRKAESVPAYCYRATEVAAMIDHCLSKSSLHWLADIVIALACTGLRIGELSELRWADIDLETGKLTLTDETGLSALTAPQRRELKSGRGRSFPIHSKLLAVFKRLPRKGPYVFYGPRGGRLKPDTVRRILVSEVIVPLTEKFPTPEGERGFKDGRLHSFRHYFCSMSANNNVPEQMVMEWLGHTESEMTRRYYHLHDEESKRRMEGVDFLGGAGGWSAGEAEVNHEEVAEPHTPETCDDRPAA